MIPITVKIISIHQPERFTSCNLLTVTVMPGIKTTKLQIEFKGVNSSSIDDPSKLTSIIRANTLTKETNSTQYQYSDLVALPLITP